MGLSFGEVRNVLAYSALIHPDQEEAFVARIKQWQKSPYNFPKGTNVGKGVRAVYGADQFFQLAFVIELLRIGLPPERAILFTESMWLAVSTAIYDTLVCMGGAARHQHYLTVRIESLAGLQVKEHPGKYGYYLSVGTLTSRDFQLAFPDHDFVQLPGQRPEFARAWTRVHRSLRGDIILELDSWLVLVLRAMKECGIHLSVFSADLAKWKKLAPKSHARFHGPFSTADLEPEDAELNERIDARPYVTPKHMIDWALELLDLPDRFAARRSEPDEAAEMDVSRLRVRWTEYEPDTPEAEAVSGDKYIADMKAWLAKNDPELLARIEKDMAQRGRHYNSHVRAYRKQRDMLNRERRSPARKGKDAPAENGQ